MSKIKILIAPDSFKGSLTALEVSESIEKGIRKILPEAEVKILPMADGGEGTVQSLVDATGGRIVCKDVTGPLGEPVRAFFGVLGDEKTAVIEMATASGLPLVPDDKKDPTRTTTYGTGELIKAALDEGVKKIVIGIGGSATNDGGVGMAQALGVRFLNNQGEEIGYGGGELGFINSIDITGLDPRIKETDVTVACDVSNPLYGKQGAAYIYGPQKGADSEMVKLLDDNLRHYSKIIERTLNKDISNIPGTGAAGGLGAGLIAFLDAELKSGIDIVLQVSNFEDHLAGVNLVITGEGSIDYQSARGKTPVGVARKAKEYGLPVVAICGMIGDDLEGVYKKGIDAVFSITKKPVSLEDSVANAKKWLEFTSEQIIRLIKTTNQL